MRPLPLTLCLLYAALAGGMDSFTRLQALKSLPRVVRVDEIDVFTALPGTAFTHRLTVTGLGGVSLYASIGEHEGGDGRRANLMIWVDGTRATAPQQAALANVAAAYLSRCFTAVTPGQVSAVRGLAGRLGQTAQGQTAQGWQAGRSGAVRIGWSGSPDALDIAGHPAVGLTVEWPAAQNRCTL